uniref:Uncharacterized protein n=2 Tax=Avena sativa TaxID=4498 RepID=A0ACD5U470_AVESA
MFPTMSGGTQSEGSQVSAAPVKPASTSCRKKNSGNTSFVTEMRDHFHEFVHASMDEHKTCLTNTVKKMFVISKAVAERTTEAKEAGAESVLSLQTEVSR